MDIFKHNTYIPSIQPSGFLMHIMKILASTTLFAFTFFFASACQSQPDTLPEVVVYKTPTCGCCAKWVDHLKEAGFEVDTNDMESLATIKKQFGVSSQNQSCHTAIVGGYVVEGHVPADVVRRMLTEKPDIVGIAVPGMPIGSPGMEVEGRPAERYQVIAFDKAGNNTVYAQR